MNWYKLWQAAQFAIAIALIITFTILWIKTSSGH